MEHPADQLAAEIAEALEFTDIPQAAIADAVGVGQQTVSAWKRRESSPALAKVGKLALVLGRSSDRWRELKLRAMEEPRPTTQTVTVELPQELLDLIAEGQRRKQDPVELALAADPDISDEDRQALVRMFRNAKYKPRPSPEPEPEGP